MLTKEDVLKIAKLSRLEFSESEIERFKVDLNNIFSYIDELSEVNTDGVEALTVVNSESVEYRSDVVRPSLSVEESMKNSPSKADGMLIVPKVVGGDN